MLETKRLSFREYTQDDFDDLSKIICDAETMKYYEKPYDANGVNWWISWSIENYRKYGFGFWVLINKETGEFIGNCGITMQNIDGELLPEIGYHINKKYWKQGYGKEAASAVRDWGFKEKHFESLYSYMNSENIASYSLARSIGMTKIKDYENEWEKLSVYRITKKEWNQLNKG